MLETDWTYSHSYEVEELTELPGNGTWDVPLFYIPRPKTRPEHDGLWLRIRPAAQESWIGVFAFGYQSPPAISRVVSTPDSGRACIISGGAAYVVKADDPSSYQQLPIRPVLDVRSIDSSTRCSSWQISPAWRLTAAMALLGGAHGYAGTN